MKPSASRRSGAAGGRTFRCGVRPRARVGGVQQAAVRQLGTVARQLAALVHRIARIEERLELLAEGA